MQNVNQTENHKKRKKNYYHKVIDFVVETL